MTDEQIKAEDKYDMARKRLNTAKGKSGSGAESEYSAAYQRLVALGLRPQIRGQYR